MSWWLRTIEQPTTLVLVILLAHFVAKRPELLGVKSNWSSAQEPLPLLFQLLSEPLPRSSAYDSLYNGLAARKQRQCILPGDSHALHDLFGRQQLLSSCEAEEEYFGLWHRLVSSVQQAWFQLSQRWRPWLTEEIVVEVLNQQRHFANLGLAALELQPATHADPLAKAVWSINNHSRPEAQVAKELQISVEAVSWLRTYGSEIAEAVDDIFTAQVLGLQQSKWLRNHKDKWNDVLGEVGGFLFGRFRGRPHPVLLHQSAEAITALMQSIWIDEKNMADQSAELEEQVERATDSGSLPDLLMKTAVDESWVLQLQSLSLGLPWLPDLPAYSGVDEAGTTHEELSRILSSKGSLSAKLLSPLQILQRNDSEASGWTSVLLSEWYPSPVVKLQEILAAGHMVNPRLAEVAQAIYQGRGSDLTRFQRDPARASIVPLKT